MIFYPNRLSHATSDLPEVIPVSFNMQTILLTEYYNIHESDKKFFFFYKLDLKPLTSDTVLPKINGKDKGVDPSLRPENNKATEYTSRITCLHRVKS